MSGQTNISQNARTAELAQAVLRGVPADQALGLRLMALARSAAAVHMAETARCATPSLHRSQAAELVSEVRA